MVRRWRRYSRHTAFHIDLTERVIRLDMLMQVLADRLRLAQVGVLLRGDAIVVIAATAGELDAQRIGGWAMAVGWSPMGWYGE